MIPKSVGLDYWSKVHAGAQCAASQMPGVKVTWNGVTDETDVVGQLNLLNNYIAQGVNGLVYAATDATAMTQVSTGAAKAGIKVVSIDSGTTPQPKNVPLLATDNIAGAKLAAAQLAKAIGPAGGKVAIIAFHAGSQTNDQRVQGFEAGLKKYKKLHLVGTQYSQNDYNTALTVTANVLTANPDLKGVFAANEASDVGAVQAIRLAHRAGKVKVVGWDTSPGRGRGSDPGSRVRSDLPGSVPDGLRRRPRGGGDGTPPGHPPQREHRRGDGHQAQPRQPQGASVRRPTLRLSEPGRHRLSGSLLRL